VADTARVLSRYVDGIVLRTGKHEKLLELAENASIPVINGLTDRTHPCQALSDVMTVEEKIGPIHERTIAWCGSYSNVAASWIHVSARLGCSFRMATPDDMAPPPLLLEWAKHNGAKVSIVRDPLEAVANADCVMTDTWVSITEEATIGKDAVVARYQKLAPYQVTRRLMETAAKHAIFMHCLPAHRGEEMTAGVIDGPQSVVFDGAENRLHAQKAILEWCMG
jgi:ornithine carbamoyltransferase